jgi:hypothetical protein
MGGMLETLSKLGLQMPSGEPEPTPPFMPPADPRQEAVESLIPMIDQMRSAAVKTPQMREEEIYKKKIKDMFGVKLGEKNPKWKSILRHLGETALDVGSTRVGAGTIRGGARRQAEADYKAENEVFGREGMGALGSIVRSLGQDKIAASKTAQAAAKLENDKIKHDLAARKLNQAGEKLVIDAKRAEDLGNVAEATALWRRAMAESAPLTPEIKLGKALTENPELGNVLNKYRGQGAYLNQLGKNAAGGGKSGGGGITTTIRKVPNEATGLMQDETTTSIRQPFSSGTNTGESRAEAARQGIIPGSTIPNPVSPGAPTSPGAAPQVADASPGSPTGPLPVPIPKAPPQSVFKQKIPGNSSLADSASKVRSRLEDGDLARFTPTAGKKYQELMGVAEDVAGINDAIWGAGTKFDKAGQSVADRYSGITGKLMNLWDRSSGDLATSAQFFKEVNDRATNAYRHLITGAGAGWKEIE